MKRFLCTLSIFLGFFVVMAVVTAALILVRVPDQVWWSPSNNNVFVNDRSASLAYWLGGNVAIPLLWAQGAFVVIYLFWDISSLVCARLRKESQ